DASVDDQRTRTAPVLLPGERANAVNVRGRVRARESYPQEVVQVPGGEIAVVHQDDERKRIDRMVHGDGFMEALERRFRFLLLLRDEPRRLDRQDARQADARLDEALR